MLDEAAPSDLMNSIIWFTNNLDPNGKTSPPGVIWPQWNPQNPKALIFQDGLLFPQIVGDDDYRTPALEYMRNISLINPI